MGRVSAADQPLPAGVAPAPPLPEGHTSEALPVTPAADGPTKVSEVVGLAGKPAKAPSGVWFAATDGNGHLLTDDDGRPVRVRSPHRPPRTPPTALGR